MINKKFFLKYFCLMVGALVIYSCSKSMPPEPDPVLNVTISFSHSELELIVGESTDVLRADVTPKELTHSINWHVADERIVSMEDGMLTALREGKTTIMAYMGEAEALCSVIVKAAPIPVQEPKIGDYFYDDGTWSNGDEAPLDSKRVIGLVFQTDPERISKADADAGYTHGYVVSTRLAYDKDRVVRPGLDVKEMEYSLDEGIECLNNCKLGSSWYSNLGGRWETYQVYNTYLQNGKSSQIPAFTYVLEQFTQAPESTSGWFLPSTGQVWDLLANFCQGELGKQLDASRTMSYDITYYFSYVTGFDAIAAYNRYISKVPQEDRDELYVPSAESYHNYCGIWTSTLYDNSDGAACLFYLGNESGRSMPCCDWVNNPYFVLPVLAF